MRKFRSAQRIFESYKTEFQISFEMRKGISRREQSSYKVILD
jgi:hypothetical protein